MRLLIYLLAMLSGFSAAEASRPVTPTPATLGSAISSASIITASVSLAEDRETVPPFCVGSGFGEAARPQLYAAFDMRAAVNPTPITKHDVSRQ
ncbi:MAG: hypothetical protein ACKVOS_03075 [Sphingorhabdus sp.]|uniref:hypothetical protein n=1 Tax=Sphingorhabdus sp. TaxID=1902408 RepID=UPI0038FD348B